MKNTMQKLTRRQALMSALVGAGTLGLRSLASGIPVAILANPERALAADVCTTTPQYLILSTSDGGDPTGCNVPGTYDDANIIHPMSADFAATNIVQAGVMRKGAAVWNTLPQALLDRMAFFHHGTYTVVHGDNASVLSLQGSVVGPDMLVSMVARQLSTCLLTTQPQPVCIGAQEGGEALSYQERVLPILGPQAIASVLVAPSGSLAKLQGLRDDTLNKLNAWVKARNIPSQQNFLDRFATSQTQLRSISTSLFGSLASIKDDSVNSQIAAAVALIQMNITPVVSIHIPFGGDNHTDSGLSLSEAPQTLTGVASIKLLYDALVKAGIADKVTFASVNVFGRTMAKSHEGLAGRDHNGNHHCAIMFGKNIRGGVVGGVTPVDGDYGASTIDSTTGLASTGGDIPLKSSLASMGKTLSSGLGLSDDVVNASITGGSIVKGALVGSA